MQQPLPHEMQQQASNPSMPSAFTPAPTNGFQGPPPQNGFQAPPQNGFNQGPSNMQQSMQQPWQNNTSNSNHARFYKPPVFHGKFGEDVDEWLERMDIFFRLNGTPQAAAVPTAYLCLQGEAFSFMRELVLYDNALDWSWQQFRLKYQWRYREVLNDGTLLRDRLQALNYEGVKKMADYIEEFSKIARRIRDITFTDLSRYFLQKLPHSCSWHIQMQIRGLPEGDATMQNVFTLARQWASNTIACLPQKQQERTKLSGKLKPLHLLQPTTSSSERRDSEKKNDSPGKSLDVNDEIDKLEEYYEKEVEQMQDQLNELAQHSGYKCNNCGEVGHFIRNCPKMKSNYRTGGNSQYSNRYSSSSRYQKKSYPSKKPNHLFATDEIADEYGFDEYGNPATEDYMDEGVDDFNDPGENDEEDQEQNLHLDLVYADIFEDTDDEEDEELLQLGH
jgi:hypothetical protein